MTARASERTPVEAALRYLGARRYGALVDLIEHAIRRPGGHAGVVLAPLTEATSMLTDWTSAERAHALWRVIEEGILQPQVSSTAQSRRRRALQAALRLPDAEIGEWGTSLTERFNQLRALRAFRNTTSTQPVEIAWKRGVERLAAHLDERLAQLRTLEDWTRYRQPEPHFVVHSSAPTLFRPPPEGAQKLIVNLYVLTLVLSGTGTRRRISERLITSQDDDGLRYYTARAYRSAKEREEYTYAVTDAVWGCRAVQVVEDEVPVTQLWFPRPLYRGEQAYFVSEAVLDASEDNTYGWTNVDIDHHGIEPGELHDGALPLRGLTIRMKFDRDRLPAVAWWYAEQSKRERYTPPPDSPRLLDIVAGDVVKTFEQPCQPRESYGIAYRWS